jgi:hypothetical protein
MYRVINIIGALVWLTIVTPVAVGASAKHGYKIRSRHTKVSQCPSAPSDVVIAADAQAVIYRLSIAAEMTPPYIYGCAHGSRRSYRLGRVIEGSAAGSVGTGPFALAGPVVAYGIEKSFTEGHSFSEVWVRDLSTGKILRKIPDGSPAEPGDVGIGETTAIVVKRDGSVAWITRASRQLGGIQVRSVDATGSHLLAASPEIEPKSLALAGNTLYWTQGGKPMLGTLE